jgi:serine/threonine protein kinase
VPFEIEGYELLGMLGRGGSGVVYKTWQRKLSRVVALKVLAAGAHASPTAVARFRAESEMIAGLAHPNIVAIHDVGEHQGVPYLCLEFVEGGSLADWLRERNEPLTPRAAARVVAALARVVQSAHDKGIVHRDLKPANVLLGRSTSDELDPERLKLTDFGLAKRLGSDIGEAVSLSGVVLGTPAYMAPEQAGRRKAKVGPAADVYSLGAILYELLTLKAPFRGDSPIEVVLDVVMKSPAPPSRLLPGIPGELESLCLRCLEKDPAKRPRSAESLADELARFESFISVSGFPARRRTGRILAGSAGLLAMLLIAQGVFSNSRMPITTPTNRPASTVNDIKLTVPARTSTFTQGVPYHATARIQIVPTADSVRARESRMTFDLTDRQHENFLVRSLTKNARIWTEVRHDVKYWGPIDDTKPFQVAYQFRFDFPVKSASLYGSIHKVDTEAQAILEVSTGSDGPWFKVAEGMTLRPHGAPVDISQFVSGSREIYVRARLKGRDDGQDSAMAQFLRTATNSGSNLEINSPRVFDLIAFDREVPMIAARLNFSDGWYQSVWIGSDGFFDINRIFDRPGLYTGTVAAEAMSIGKRTKSFELWINSPKGKIDVSDRESIIEPQQPYAVCGVLTGGGIGPWEGEVDYGDGSGRQSLPVAANATFQLDHQYQSLGTYHPRITIKNQAGDMWTDFPRCHVSSKTVPSGLGQ